MSYLELLKNLRSQREMEATKLDEKLFDEVIEHLRYAANGRNMQVLRYAYLSEPSVVQEVFNLTNLPSIHKITDEQKPSAFIVIGYTGEKTNDMLLGMDVGIASQIIREFYHEKGFASLVVYTVNKLGINKLLGFDKEEFDTICVIPLGKSNQVVHVEDSNEAGYYKNEQGEQVVKKLTSDILVVKKQ